MNRHVWIQLTQIKTVKVLKTLIEKFEQVPDSLDDQIFVCEKSIEFAKREKRVFLGIHSVTFTLSKKVRYKDSLALINDLLREFKKLDDKPSLVDVQLRGKATT
ncbi:ANL_HP_G0146500.mRNA.1.CDS.1 [Saccharomyces cerevisiae]|nr:ANL_HP_G0146500.mRNA.1.CDS.1 [Saccharomyces cerevisiae]CAI7009161.1 ANL_HP_G0146500.mRNA.1.CDS.1 [Saccharomyces cerevisiae]